MSDTTLGEYRSRRGSTFVRTDCVTCGAECNADTGAHNQRAWARTHVINNPDHQVHVETTHIRVYRNAQPPKEPE
jgi:hypothetical protein